MDYEDPLLRISINYEDQAEKDYLDNILIPRLTTCYMCLDIEYITDYYIINATTYKHLAHLLMNISLILQDYMAVDYCQSKGFVVWFDIPKTIEENVESSTL